MKKNRVLGSILMLVASLIWGSAFVAQTVGMESIGPFTFTGIRISLGALALLPVCLIKDRFEAKKNPLQEKKTVFYQTGAFVRLDDGACFFRGVEFSTICAFIYDGGEISVYHCALYRVRAAYRRVHEKESAYVRLGRGSDRIRRLVFFERQPRRKRVEFWGYSRVRWQFVLYGANYFD